MKRGWVGEVLKLSAIRELYKVWETPEISGTTMSIIPIAYIYSLLDNAVMYIMVNDVPLHRQWARTWERNMCTHDVLTSLYVRVRWRFKLNYYKQFARVRARCFSKSFRIIPVWLVKKCYGTRATADRIVHITRR